MGRGKGVVVEIPSSIDLPIRLRDKMSFALLIESDTRSYIFIYFNHLGSGSYLAHPLLIPFLKQGPIPHMLIGGSMMSRRAFSLFSLAVTAMILMSEGGAVAGDPDTVDLTLLTPAQKGETDLCHVATSRSCLCALDCKTGEVVFNFCAGNDTGEAVLSEKSDRDRQTGGAKPSRMAITLTWGMSSSYNGVGGSFDNPDLPTPKAILGIHWRYVF